jgi:hypothetical protein
MTPSVNARRRAERERSVALAAGVAGAFRGVAREGAAARGARERMSP